MADCREVGPREEPPPAGRWPPARGLLGDSATDGAREKGEEATGAAEHRGTRAQAGGTGRRARPGVSWARPDVATKGERREAPCVEARLQTAGTARPAELQLRHSARPHGSPTSTHVLVRAGPGEPRSTRKGARSGGHADSTAGSRAEAAVTRGWDDQRGAESPLGQRTACPLTATATGERGPHPHQADRHGGGPGS